jgi:pimeloyl-ACP methyl ester carboxylesterase
VGLVFQDVSFASRVDRVELKGWFLPSGSDSVILIVNGGFRNRVDPIVDTLDLSRDLVTRGYNILLFDLRGRGESQGKARSLSDIERDIGGAIDYLKSRGYPSGRIGIIGYCSGAASVCIFASEEDVGGIVLDGCFTSARDMVYHQASSRGIPRVPVIVFVPGVQLAATVFYGYEAVNPIDVVGRVRCPIFFIHEENDDLVPPQETVELFNASGNPSNMYWQVPDTSHSRSYETHPTEYVARLDAFFRIALMTTPSTK